MLHTVKKCLAMCSVVFPGFGEADDLIMESQARLFTMAFNDCGLSKEDVDAGFRHHIKTARRFPVPADIIDASMPVTVYRMDNGPLGFGALYHRDHPYVRLQVRIGTDISRHEERVRPQLAKSLIDEAKNALPIRVDVDDDEPAIERRPSISGGFKRLSFDRYESE